jgi:tRNA 2-thiouridine synthesizing protein C
LAKRPLTLIARRAPYGGDGARQTLDIAFAAAVFERDVRYLFIGDGVYQLLRGQETAGIAAKPHAAALETLELYGIETVYVLKSALNERGIDTGALAIPVNLIDDTQLQTLIEGDGPIINL